MRADPCMTSALTGESVPREIEPGSEVLSGCININGLISVEVTKEGLTNPP